MKKPATRRSRRVKIGRERFEMISSVEGLNLSFSASREFAADEEDGLTAEQRRARIIDKYAGRS